LKVLDVPGDDKRSAHVQSSALKQNSIKRVRIATRIFLEHNIVVLRVVTTKGDIASHD
jgi:hypothetical protein